MVTKYQQQQQSYINNQQEINNSSKVKTRNGNEMIGDDPNGMFMSELVRLNVKF
jgi:hypothetical protein